MFITIFVKVDNTFYKRHSEMKKNSTHPLYNNKNANFFTHIYIHLLKIQVKNIFKFKK